MSKALELAEWADLQCDPGSECAAELRRLADVNADLLEALIDTLDALECWTGSDIRIEKARAAIKKATE